MSGDGILRQQLVATREQAKALLTVLDAALATWDRPAVEETDCHHAGRLAAPRMTRPTAWVCPACGAEGDD